MARSRICSRKSFQDSHNHTHLVTLCPPQSLKPCFVSALAFLQGSASPHSPSSSSASRRTRTTQPASQPASQLASALLNQILLISLYLFPLMQTCLVLALPAWVPLWCCPSVHPLVPLQPLWGGQPTVSLPPEPREAAPAPPGLRAAPTPGFNNNRRGKRQRRLAGGQRDAG